MPEIPISKFIDELSREEIRSKSNLSVLKELKALKEIAQRYEGEDRVVSSEEILKKIKERPEEEKIFTGITGLDEVLGGFRRKQLVVLAAPTKSGKTSFCIDLTSRLKDQNPLWFPFEEPAEELIQKFLDRKETPPEFFSPEVMSGNTMNWIEKKIIEGIAKYGCRFVFIDHLHFIVPFSGERHDLRVGETMRSLKGLAKKWDVTIVLIAHLKKTDMTVQPSLEDLRDSSFVAQEADTVIMLYREATRADGQVNITNNVNLSVQANRRTGKTGNVKLIYKDGHFLEKDWMSGVSEEDGSFLTALGNV